MCCLGWCQKKKSPLFSHLYKSENLGFLASIERLFFRYELAMWPRSSDAELSRVVKMVSAAISRRKVAERACGGMPHQ